MVMLLQLAQEVIRAARYDHAEQVSTDFLRPGPVSLVLRQMHTCKLQPDPLTSQHQLVYRSGTSMSIRKY